MKDRERGVSFYDLFVESRLHGETDMVPRPVSVSAALDIAHTKTGGQPFSVGSGAIKVTIADWQRNAARRDHYLVINRADASLPDIPLRHLETGVTRMAGKARREGIDLSCHLLIRESRNANRPALMLVTNGSSLSTDKICSVLGHLFRSAKHDAQYAEHFQRAHPNGVEGKTLTLNSLFSVAGHQNATLANLLNGGHLEGLELISEADQQLDAASPLEVTGVQFTLEPIRPGRIGVATITRAIAALRNRGVDPTKARVRYVPQGRTKSETHTFEVGALENAFVRRDVIRFQDPIAARYERVEMRIMNPLVALADRENI